MTAQLLDLTSGNEFKADGRPGEGYHPCFVLRISTGETIGGFRTEQTARLAAETRGAVLVATEPPEWAEHQREMCRQANQEAARRRWEKERRRQNGRFAASAAGKVSEVQG